MRRRVLLFLAVVFMLFLAGCGGKTPASSTISTKPRVAFVFTQSLGDKGPMDAMNESLKKAQVDFEIDVSVFEALQASQHEEALRTFAREGYNLIATAFPAMVEPLKTVAAEFPNTKFCLIFPMEIIEMPNVVTVDFAIWEAYYLAGIMGATMSDRGKLGHVVGAEEAALLANYNAFKAGAKSVNPSAEVLLANTNTFDDPAKGKEAALSLSSQGCDLFITDCAKTALGTIEASVEKNLFVMGDSNAHYDLAPKNVLLDTSIEFGPSLYVQIAAFAKDQFEAGVHFSDLKEGGVGIIHSPLIRNSLTDAQRKRYDEAYKLIEENSEKIKNGVLVVEMNINK